MKRLPELAALIAALVLLSACGKAGVEGRFTYAPSCGDLVVKVPDGTALKTVDTVSVTDRGTFRFSFDVPKGQPQFVYLYCGGGKVASLLLSRADRVKLVCDSVGRWTVEGSEDCDILREGEERLASLLAGGEITGRSYTSYYREMTRFVMAHSHSLAVIPVLYGKAGDFPLFGNDTDAILFSSIADSLSTVYPDSKYVRALRAEADTRLKGMELNRRLADAPLKDYPELSLPDTGGKTVSLSSVVGKKTLLVFWNASSTGDKLFNQDVLSPLYSSFKDRGLRIYEVNLGADKANWAMVVREQKLPWTNVCDIRGASAVLYGVTATPSVFLIDGNGLKRIENVSEKGIRASL